MDTVVTLVLVSFTSCERSLKLKLISVNCQASGKCSSQRSVCGGSISSAEKDGLLECIELGLESTLQFDNKNLTLKKRENDHFYDDNGFFMNGFMVHYICSSEVLASRKIFL